MGNDKNDKTGGLLGNPLPIVMVVMLAAGVLVKNIPLESARPTDPERVKYVPTSQQDVEARLWQDPFAAVEKHEKHSDQSNSSASHTVKSLHARILERNDPDLNRLTVVAVSVSGGSYAETAESRRRSRFAVVSALGFHRYYPENENAIGYFHIDLPESQSTPSTFDLVVPYEWYENRDGGNTSTVLVLWLNEDKLTSQPLTKLQALVKKLAGVPLDTSGPNFQLIGPAGSAMLTELVPAMSKALPKPAAEEKSAPGKPTPLKMSNGSTLEVFAPGATISNCDLNASGVSEGKIPWDCFMPESQTQLTNLTTLPIVRTTGTDDVLAAALLWELWQRGVNRKQAHKGQCADGLVLIGERDTEYGRTLLRYLQDGFSARCGKTVPLPVGTFSYLRGLDGVLPDIDKSGSKAPPKDGNSKSTDLRAQLEDAPPEHAEGRSQFDYLRRLADEIDRLDDDKKFFAEHGVQAIGIVGSDVYDKLLILQALRGRFKDKIFFTTDLDARYLHADQKDWARNLVVASNFGLSLHPTLQGSTLPFRDSYQTATYLATLMALTHRFDPACNWNCKMNDWLRPKIFEIGRTEAVHLASPSVTDLTRWLKDTEPNGNAPSAARTPCEGDWTGCKSIEPVWSSRSPSLDQLPKILIMLGFGIVLASLANRRVNETVCAAFAAPSPERDAVRATIYKAIGAVAVVFIILRKVWIDMEDSLAQGIGEPFLWLQGVSAWPSLVLRFICFVTMLALCYLSLKMMEKHDKSISEHFKIALPQIRTLSRSRWAAAWNGPHLNLALFAKKDNAEPNSAVREESVEKTIDVITLWQNYLRATSRNEMAGWIVVSLIIGAILLTLAFQVLGRTSFPHRGELVERLHHVLVGFNALVLWLVIFWVGYETRACARLIETLSGAPSLWPKPLLDREEAETGVPRASLDDYLDFQLMVRATQRIQWLIYLPFVSILFMVVARSDFFDAMDYPPALVFVTGLALGYSLYSARLLRSGAEEARATLLEHYERRLLEEARSKVSKPPVLIVHPGTIPAQRPISVEQIKILMERIRSTREGAFAPFSQQPALHALLLPFGGYGSVQLIEYLFKP
jgi:hypothetical protein